MSRAGPGSGGAVAPSPAGVAGWRAPWAGRCAAAARRPQAALVPALGQQRGEEQEGSQRGEGERRSRRRRPSAGLVSDPSPGPATSGAGSGAARTGPRAAGSCGWFPLLPAGGDRRRPPGVRSGRAGAARGRRRRRVPGRGVPGAGAWCRRRRVPPGRRRSPWGGWRRRGAAAARACGAGGGGAGAPVPPAVARQRARRAGPGRRARRHRPAWPGRSSWPAGPRLGRSRERTVRAVARPAGRRPRCVVLGPGRQVERRRGAARRRTPPRSAPVRGRRRLPGGRTGGRRRAVRAGLGGCPAHRRHRPVGPGTRWPRPAAPRRAALRDRARRRDLRGDAGRLGRVTPRPAGRPVGGEAGHRHGGGVDRVAASRCWWPAKAGSPPRRASRSRRSRPRRTGG